MTGTDPAQVPPNTEMVADVALAGAVTVNENVPPVTVTVPAVHPAGTVTARVVTAVLDKVPVMVMVPPCGTEYGVLVKVTVQGRLAASRTPGAPSITTGAAQAAPVAMVRRRGPDPLWVFADKNGSIQERSSSGITRRRCTRWEGSARESYHGFPHPQGPKSSLPNS